MAYVLTCISNHSRCFLVAVCIAFACGATPSAGAADISISREQFKTGQYASCLESTQKAIEDRVYGVEWRLLMVKSLMALGRYDRAGIEVDVALQDLTLSVPLMKLAHTAYTQSGQAEQAAEILARIYRIARIRRIDMMDSPDLVAVGQALLLLGGEPRVVLDEFYNRAITEDPNCREAYLASGSLAVDKQDYELAAAQYRTGLERFGDDPDLHYGLAQAFYQSDRNSMILALDAALFVNPRHAPALILLAEHQIDCENYAGASALLDRVIAVNPWHPEAWAYRAVLAHLTNEPNQVEHCRAQGLKYWQDNPQVDYLIGRKLAQKYRFAEGARYQRQALAFDPAYLPAKGQLAEDLLRLGKEQEGWTLADEVHAQDGYNVEAFNLVNLRDNLAKFKTLRENGFVVRMDEREAAVYGDRVVALLAEAKSQLCRKYGLELDGPVTVELFPNQQDFAVRTFGMPGGDGFLGVCFGDVITANSPKLERTSNWEAMLWHEFCHVVTLNLTHNKMPRWLSEGMSVYEEVQRNPRWGQQMTPQYRRMILGGELTPISGLSAAFLSPPSPMHLQFAYYESSLVIEFLVERFGPACLPAILADLGKGEEVNAVIARHTAPLEKIEKDFEAFARRRAEALAPGVDWEQPDTDQVNPADPEAVARWLGSHPNSFWALTLHATRLLGNSQWEQAKEPLEKLISLYPEYTGEGNAYRLLAEAHRQLGQTDQERRVLAALAERSAEAPDAYGRLMEIGIEREQWQEVVENGDKYLAVYPLQGAVHRQLGQACEELDQDVRAVESYRRLLLLDPADPADVNYRLARLLRHRDPATARRHILEALADAPRFRQGHRLLLEMQDDAGDSPAPGVDAPQVPMSPEVTP